MTEDLSAWLDGVESHWDLEASISHDNIGLIIKRLRAALKVVERLEQCGTVFRSYEQIHAAKPDIGKATANARLAEMCEETVAAFRAACQSEGGKDG